MTIVINRSAHLSKPLRQPACPQKLAIRLEVQQRSRCHTVATWSRVEPAPIQLYIRSVSLSTTPLLPAACEIYTHR